LVAQSRHRLGLLTNMERFSSRVTYVGIAIHADIVYVNTYHEP